MKPRYVMSIAITKEEAESFEKNFAPEGWTKTAIWRLGLETAKTRLASKEKK